MPRRLYDRLAARIGRGPVSRTVPTRLPGPDSDGAEQAAIRRVRAIFHQGDLDGAVSEAHASELGLGDATRLAALADSIESTRRVTTPGWLPDLGPTDATPGEPTRGRVLMLVTNSVPYRQGGFALRTHAVALAQRAAGLDPHVVTRPGEPHDPAAPSHVVVEGIDYHALAPGAAALPLEPAMGRHLRLASALEASLRPSVVHVAEAATMLGTTVQVGLALGRARGLPVVFEVRGFREESWLTRGSPGLVSSQRYRLTRDCDTWCMTAADAVVTLNEAMRRDLEERGLPADRITVIPNAVDIHRFLPTPPDPELIERLDIREGQVVIGYAGALQPYEGLTTLVSAVAALIARGRDIRLLLVGRGQAEEAIRARVAELGVGDRVTFTGLVPHADIPRWYSVMDIVANARTDDLVSRLVGPTKPLEALAMERALVVSRTPALMECIVEGVTGLAASPDSADDLAATLDSLVCDPALRARLGSAGRHWVETERSWAANGSTYQRLFERLGAA